MKKTITALLLLAMVLSLAGCGGSSSAQNAEPTAAPTEEPAVEYCGTWKPVSYEQNGVSASVEALRNNGNYGLSYTGIILRDGGEAYFYTMASGSEAAWEETDSGITVGNIEFLSDGGKLILNISSTENCYFEKISNDTTFPGERDITAESFYGTWNVIGGYVTESKSTFTLAKLEEVSAEAASLKMIFSDNGQACLIAGDTNTSGAWTYSDGAIQSGSSSFPYINDLIVLEFDDGYSLYLAKTSDDQTFPESTGESTAEAETQSTGLRAEFKEAMDSYEAFYTEYCELLKQYKKNPTDMSILTKYMNLMGKLTEMDEAFEKWESEDLNSEELKYYLDVNNRVLKMLTDAAS